MISNLYPVYVNSVKSGVFDGSLAGFKDALIKRNIAFENLLPAVYREGLIGSGIETDYLLDKGRLAAETDEQFSDVMGLYLSLPVKVVSVDEPFLPSAFIDDDL